MTAKDVYRLDVNARWLGIPTHLLMENAGKSVADIIKREFPKIKNIVIVASKSNNGGDALVVARHLSRFYRVKVIFLGYPQLIRSEEAKLNWEIIQGLYSVEKVIIKDSTSLHKLERELSEAELVVDGIFGVGLKGTPRGLLGEAIDVINKLKQKYNFKVLSIDVPSGFDTSRGTKTEKTIEADLVVTFHDTKKGLDSLGIPIFVEEIGIPRDAEIFVGPGDFIDFVRERPSNVHKGNYGRILIIGGSKYYTGAPTLSALAALRTGADLVFIMAPSKIADVIRAFSPNLIVLPYTGESLQNIPLDYVKEFTDNIDVVVIGPGISREEGVLKKAYELIKLIEKPMIIDADAIKALGKFGIPKDKRIIVTPHAGEFKALFHISLPDDLEERMNMVKSKAKENKLTILLKGPIDIISNGKELLLNKTGNPGMTVGGTGDVLTGIVAAIHAINKDEFKSAAMGAFLCGFAGDLALKEKGYSLLATDVIEEIPLAIQKIKEFVFP